MYIGDVPLTARITYPFNDQNGVSDPSISVSGMLVSNAQARVIGFAFAGWFVGDVRWLRISSD
ncbi:hypothetical protein ACFSE0_19755 [Ochrobactrum teleogrylli]|uniref:Uncharacterized protein n=1 Tax=Ochrobactrum teleogrylli TaxID=2479765 RepID=A0ABY2XZW3_9HYPH|nr:hypothetical protein [[Ochrobactrum] teleogrylli]TNV11502.1 hypothetical protein FIC94_18470 [[Ochrobactrum] teleogrylli]